MRVKEILLSLVVIIGCTTKRHQVDLVERTFQLDTLFRQKEIDPVSIFPRLVEMENQLLKSDQRNTENDEWETGVNFKWNTDSTITFIRSFKQFKKGFKRRLF